MLKSKIVSSLKKVNFLNIFSLMYCSLSIIILPPSIFMELDMLFIRVVLPDPFGPTNALICPFSNPKLTLSKIVIPLYFFSKSITCNIYFLFSTNFFLPIKYITNVHKTIDITPNVKFKYPFC